MPLTERQRRHLAQRLEEERAHVERLLNRSIEVHADAPRQDRIGDRGAGSIDDEIDSSNATRMSRELAEIDAAIARMRDAPQQFGICEDTGRPIPFARLDVIPWARTCDQAGA
jgi:RNA polymerase-binding transcription factor DksA